MAVRAQIADHLLDEAILARRRRRAMQHRPAMLQHVTPRVCDDIAHDAGCRCHQMQLAQRSTVAPHERRQLPFRDFVCTNQQVVELQTATRGHALTHAVPVVEYVQSLALHGHDNDNRIAIHVVHIQPCIVRKGCAGRIVFLAGEPEVLTPALQLRGDFAWSRRTPFSRRAAENRTIEHTLDLHLVKRRAR